MRLSRAIQLVCLLLFVLAAFAAAAEKDGKGKGKVAAGKDSKEKEKVEKLVHTPPEEEASDPLQKKIQKFLKLRRKIAEHEAAPEKKDVQKIEQLQQAIVGMKSELTKAGVDINFEAEQDDLRQKVKESRHKLKEEERALDSEFHVLWAKKLGEKGYLDHCKEDKAETPKKVCKPADPEHDPNIATLEQRLQARIKKLELKLEEAKMKLDWYVSNKANKKDEL